MEKDTLIFYSEADKTMMLVSYPAMNWKSVTKVSGLRKELLLKSQEVRFFLVRLGSMPLIVQSWTNTEGRLSL